MKVIIQANTPAKIPYMDNPPAKGGEIKYLTTAEFKEKFNCEYTEGVVVKDESMQPATAEDFKDARAKAAYERLNKPLDSLVICKMSDKVGYGLFTTKDIPIGTVICIYAGEHNPRSREFVYSCNDTDALKAGGFARFMQHQPISKKVHEDYLLAGLKNPSLLALQENINEEEAEKLLADQEYVTNKTKKYNGMLARNAAYGDYLFDGIEFSDKQPVERVAQSNVYYEATEIAGVTVIIMIAASFIKANESIGFSYGPVYWRHPSISSPPALFTKSGEIISPDFYRYKNDEELDRAMNSLFGLGGYRYDSDSSDEEDYFYKDKSAARATEPASANYDDILSNLIERIKYVPKFDSSAHIFNPGQQSPTEYLANERKQEKLLACTVTFFKKHVDAQWKAYPESSLKGKYVGHQVRYFTMSKEVGARAKEFTKKLQQEGFDAELKAAGEKPSVVVDLSASKVSFK